MPHDWVDTERVATLREQMSKTEPVMRRTKSVNLKRLKFQISMLAYEKAKRTNKKAYYDGLGPSRPVAPSLNAQKHDSMCQDRETYRFDVAKPAYERFKKMKLGGE